ncbi:MAG: cell division protein FtsH, partial [Ruminococcus sp.]|nr:cell division protein FtsH [Ruminococcus sp.]
VTKFGMSEKFGMTALEITNDRYLSGNSSLICSPDTAYEIDIETRNIISQCYKNAADILRQNMDKLRRLTDYLLEKETLSGIEFMSIIAEK